MFGVSRLPSALGATAPPPQLGDLPSLSPDLCGTEVKTANALSHVSQILPVSLGLVTVPLAKLPLVQCPTSGMS